MPEITGRLVYKFPTRFASEIWLAKTMATFETRDSPGLAVYLGPSQQFIAPNCETHPDMVIQFWCITCKTRVCLTCFEEDHDEHSLKPFKKYLKEEVAFHLEVSGVKLQILYERSGQLISRFENRVKRSKEQKAYLLDERRKIDSLKADLPKLKNFSKDPKFDVSLNVVESAVSCEAMEWYRHFATSGICGRKGISNRTRQRCKTRASAKANKNQNFTAKSFRTISSTCICLLCRSLPTSQYSKVSALPVKWIMVAFQDLAMIATRSWHG